MFKRTFTQGVRHLAEIPYAQDLVAVERSAGPVVHTTSKSEGGGIVGEDPFGDWLAHPSSSALILPPARVPPTLHTSESGRHELRRRRSGAEAPVLSAASAAAAASGRKASAKLRSSVEDMWMEAEFCMMEKVWHHALPERQAGWHGLAVLRSLGALMARRMGAAGGHGNCQLGGACGGWQGGLL
uniref:Uncharacterized protein n=1 Tax=Alexandrium monilatum TaxID=311494 RepID=A0A7S4QWC3_9DINO|mmetsp:Transcript_29776/g.93023  ORF Transcript_29776/g.93023 Transcript_29776/m.93023 type:complete len:185 (+) Transcript_29776:36-590(+)